VAGVFGSRTVRINALADAAPSANLGRFSCLGRILAAKRRRWGAPIAIVWALVNFGVRLANVDNHCDIAMRLRNVGMSFNPSPCLIPMAHDMMF
jgi:hypothetical protein